MKPRRRPRARRPTARAVVSRRTFVKTLSAVSVPPSLSAADFDPRYATMFQLGRRPAVTIVPPAEVCGKTGVTLAGIGDKPTSWLLVRRDAFGELRGLEVEVVPSGRRGGLAIRLLRSSGRCIAEGTARLVSERVVDFRVTALGKTRAQRRRPRRLVVAGRLIAGRQWRVQPRL